MDKKLRKYQVATICFFALLVVSIFTIISCGVGSISSTMDDDDVTLVEDFTVNSYPNLTATFNTTIRGTVRNHDVITKYNLTLQVYVENSSGKQSCLNFTVTLPSDEDFEFVKKTTTKESYLKVTAVKYKSNGQVYEITKPKSKLSGGQVATIIAICGLGFHVGWIGAVISLIRLRKYKRELAINAKYQKQMELEQEKLALEKARLELEREQLSTKNQETVSTKTLVCEYCGSANPVGSTRCQGCGAKLH